MKHILLTLSLLLSALTLSATRHTFKYTFTSQTFTRTVTSDLRDTFRLNNRTFIASAINNKPVSCTYIPSRGLRITSTTTVPFSIYSKTADTTLTASITIETKTTNDIKFTRPSATTPDHTVLASSSGTVSYTYTTSNVKGPKITIQLNNNDTVYIKSIEFLFGSSNPSSPSVNLYDNTTLIASFPADSLPLSLPSITSTDPRFSFSGWTASSSSLYDDSTAPSDLMTSITEAPASSLDLSPVYIHYRPASTPDILTIIPSTTSGTNIHHPFSLSSPALLASLHFFSQGHLTTTEPSKFSLTTPDFSLSTLIDMDDTRLPQFHPLIVNTYIPASTPLTLTSHRLSDPLQVDSIVAITYPSPEPRFYSQIPLFPQYTDLTIDFPTTIPVNQSLTAIDAATYSLTIDDSRFYFLSLPFSVPLSNITISPLSGPHPRTYLYGSTPTQYLGDYLFSEYDQTTNTWHDLSLSEITASGLQANHGYLIGLIQPNTSATFTFRSATGLTISTSQPTTSISTPLNTNPDPRFSGWNLIGNPYLTPLSPSSIYTSDSRPLNYILIPNNHNSYDIISKYSEENLSAIPPFTSFFIQSLTPTTVINPSTSQNLPKGKNGTASGASRFPSEPTTLGKREPSRFSMPAHDASSKEPSRFSSSLDLSQEYHFNIICETPTSSSTLTIISSDSLSDSYEPNYDLLSLSPETDITHDNLAIYASNLTPGDTITLTLPSSDATLTIGNNINIPDSWQILLDPSIPAAIIIDNTPTSTPETTPDPTHDPLLAIYTIDGRSLPLNTTLRHGIYILRYSSGKTVKIIK